MTGSLSGVRVIDFGQYIAGPLTGMLLADQGADVIRVDPPGGPMWDTPANATWNRGKRSIVLDLKSNEGIATAKQLIATADVVVENFRPRVMDRLGIGPKAMSAANPGLIYCSMPGFSADDTRFDVAAWEGVVGAATATYSTSAIGADEDGEPSRPVYTAIPISSSYAAFVGTTSIAMALIARERHGFGQIIEAPLFDATYQAIGVRGVKYHDQPQPPRGGAAWVRQYECADGRWVQFHAANTRFIHQFVDAAGVSSWKDEGLTERAQLAGDLALNAELLERLTALFKTRPAQEWEDLVNAAGTPTAICRQSVEWLTHEHAIESDAVATVDDPILGPMVQPGVQVSMSETPGAIQGPAPVLDADRDEILAGLAAKPDDQSRPPAPSEVRGVLAGMKVLDLCIILAGPTCGRTLAEFGANVIKIDNPDREGGIALHHDINRGKESVYLDLKTAAGQEVFWRLAEDADVIVQNYRLGVVERLGIDYESVRKRRPDIVYATLNAYGEIGPWSERPGWEQLAQATTGMQARYGGDGPPVLQPFPVNDYGTGFMGAYAVALALLHKQKTGQGQHVFSALARTALTLQSQHVAAYEGKTWDEPSGQDSLGSGPLHRLYQTANGWFFLGAKGSQLDDLAETTGIDASLQGAELEAALEQAFVTKETDDWTALLVEQRIGAYSSRSVDNVMNDPAATRLGMSITRDHDGVGSITTNGPSAHLSRTPLVPGKPAAVPGADGIAVLSNIMDTDEITSLIQDGVLVVPDSAGVTV